MDNKSTFITISVRKHIKEFLVAEFGKPGEEYIRAHQNSFLGKTILIAAAKLPYRQIKEKAPLTAPSKPKNATKPNIVADLKILLPKELRHQTITEEARNIISYWFEKYFQQQYIFFIKGQVAVTGNELGAINMFLRLYNIDTESYDPEVARKCWRDYKDRIYKVNNTPAPRFKAGAFA